MIMRLMYEKGYEDAKAMEELSKRAGLHRVRQAIACCRSHTGSTQVSN